MLKIAALLKIFSFKTQPELKVNLMIMVQQTENCKHFMTS